MCEEREDINNELTLWMQDDGDWKVKDELYLWVSQTWGNSWLCNGFGIFGLSHMAVYVSVVFLCVKGAQLIVFQRGTSIPVWIFVVLVLFSNLFFLL